MTLNGGCVVFHPSALSHYLGGEFHNCILRWNIYSAHGVALQHIEFHGFFISANFLFLVNCCMENMTWICSVFYLILERVRFPVVKLFIQSLFFSQGW
jgi:hypothetical protein